MGNIRLRTSPCGGGGGRDVGGGPARADDSLRVGYTALPDERKVHQRVTPYGGGGAMLVGFCVALLGRRRRSRRCGP